MHVTVFNRTDMTPLNDFATEYRGEIVWLSWLDDQRLLIGTVRIGGEAGYATSYPIRTIATLDGKPPTQLTRKIWNTIEGDSKNVLAGNCVDVPDSKECKPQIRRQEIGKDDDEGELLIEGAAGHEAGAQLGPRARASRRSGRRTAPARSTSTSRPTRAGRCSTTAASPAWKLYPWAVTFDGKTGYFTIEGKDGPDVFEKYDFTSGQRTVPDADPARTRSSRS